MSLDFNSLLVNMSNVAGGGTHPVIASFTSNSGTLGTTFTPTAPSGTVAGDLIICNIGCTRTVTIPNGWEEVGGSGTAAQLVLWIIATGSTLPMITFSGTTTCHASTYRITGFSATTPVDRTVWGAYNATGSITYTTPSITPTFNNTLALALFAANGSYSLISIDNGMTIDVQNPIAWSSHNASKTLSNTAPTGTFTGTWSNAPVSENGMTMNIIPSGQSSLGRNRYWVGGTGSWTETDTSHWSSASGGAGGASVPNQWDNAIFDSGSSSSSYTVTVNTPGSWQAPCLDLITTAPSSGNLTLTLSGRGIINAYGNVSFYAGMIAGVISIGAHLVMRATNPSTLTTNGVNLPWLIQIFATTSVTLLDDLSCINYEGVFFMSKGTFDANNHNVTTSSVNFNQLSYVKNIYLGTGTWELINGSFGVPTSSTAINIYPPATPSASIIKFTGTNGARYISNSTAPGTRTYGTVEDATTGSGYIWIANGVTLDTLKITGIARTLKFNMTTTLRDILCSGTAGNLNIFAPSTAAVAYNLVKSGGGTINNDYLSISYCHATPSPSTWYVGANSVDGGNNTGLNFS